MKLLILFVALMAAAPAYAGMIIRSLPALDEFGLITLALFVGLVGARAVRRFKGRGKTDD
jgi:hypothetical protein